MIREETITKFDRTDAELEEVLLFWILVAGKEANTMAFKLEDFLDHLQFRFHGSPPRGRLGRTDSPFTLIRKAIDAGILQATLLQVRMGKYTLMERALREVVNLDPRTATVEDLEAVPGIGPKTARAFVMHSRPAERVAALDTHLLKFLRAWLNDETIPKATPPAGRRYRDLEQKFLDATDAIGVSAAALDLAVWKAYAGRGDDDLKALLELPMRRAAA